MRRSSQKKTGRCGLSSVNKASVTSTGTKSKAWDQMEPCFVWEPPCAAEPASNQHMNSLQPNLHCHGTRQDVFSIPTPALPPPRPREGPLKAGSNYVPVLHERLGVGRQQGQGLIQREPPFPPSVCPTHSLEIPSLGVLPRS